EFGEPAIQNEVAANTFGHKPYLNREVVPDSCPRKGEKRMEFVLMPSTRSNSEDETTTIGIRPQELLLNSPSTPDKPHKWIQPVPQSTPEGKRWNQTRSVEADLVPINVTGETLERHANTHHSLFNTETAMNPKSTLRRRRTVTGLHEAGQPQQGALTEGTTSPPHMPMSAEAAPRLFTFDEDMNVTNGKRDAASNLGIGQPFSTTLRKSYEHSRRHSENYIMRYPSASSEDSQSTENVSVMTDQEGSQKTRTRSRSISLKKPKKKPVPPVRSVSLKKHGVSPKLGEVAPNISPRENRPAKLFIPSEKQVVQSESMDSNESSGFISDARSSSATPTLRDGEPIRYPEQWFLNDWKSNDPYRSLSNSSTATGITVIECAKSRGSSESLTSPSISRATTPSQLSVEAESKMSSPGKLPGLMSPSSGYSSQSETPTTAFPISVYQGHIPQPVGKAKPKVPERKSSLQPISPNEKSPKSKRVFDLPITPPPHLDLSGLKLSFKSKSKASRRHSDSSNSTKPNQKHSPNQPSMPVITQTVLESVRLRSVSRSETEDNTDILNSPQETHIESSETPKKKIRPPVPGKPPMSKRPSSIILKVSPTEPTIPVVLKLSETPPRKGFATVFRKVGVKKQESVDAAGSQKPLASPEPASHQPNYLHSNHMGNKQLRGTPATADESQRKSYTELTRSSTQYIEKKKSKTPPPVPKKPNVLIVPTNTAHILVVTERSKRSPLHSPDATPDSNSDHVLFTNVTFEKDLQASNVIASHDQKVEASIEAIRRTSTHLEGNRNKEYNDGYGPCQTLSTAQGQNLADMSLNLTTKQRTQSGDIVMEDDDEVFISPGIQRSTEDLFTVIHRSKRKVLGWKEPGEPFTVRHVAVSPVKPPVTPPNIGLKFSPPASGNGAKTSTSNENFKALLQKKGSKPAPGMRMSAAELLKSTNPLARRIATEFTQESERCQPIPESVSPESTSRC
ncbi:hypothetical protein scyTo_0016986, partial [Scyliorhinus torazame]|nr:hypothetical protein [Scyliorhinus torazame]